MDTKLIAAAAREHFYLQLSKPSATSGLKAQSPEGSWLYGSNGKRNSPPPNSDDAREVVVKD